MIFLWDTDTFSAWERGNAAVAERLRRLAPDDLVAASAVTVREALRGRLAIVAQARTDRHYAIALQSLVSSLDALQLWTILPYTPEVQREFAALRTGRGHLGAADLRIAATDIASQAVLVTRNTGHFEGLSALETQNWVDPAPAAG